MTNTKATKTAADRSLARVAITGIAASVAPLAVVIGVAAMNVPAAEAYGSTMCTRIGNTVTCHSY